MNGQGLPLTVYYRIAAYYLLYKAIEEHVRFQIVDQINPIYNLWNITEPPMQTVPHLLTDDQMQDFIYTGMHAVSSSLPASVHAAIHEDLAAWFAAHDNPGNDIPARVPALKAVFEDPAVIGALTSILGPDYLIHRHRHCHNHQPGASAQDMHKDYPAVGNVRDHHPRLVLILYYPQQVRPDMGPTAVQPGSQYYMSPQEDIEEIALCCEGGTVVITHYDIWHRATANRSSDTRYMVKFLGVRTQEPTQPTWQSDSPEWTHPGDTSLHHDDLCKHLWRWYRGESTHPPSTAENGAGLASDGSEYSERKRVNRYYKMSASGEEALPDLMTAMIAEAEEKWEANQAKGDFTNPGQLDSIFGLAATGVPAVQPLIEHLSHTDARVRSAAAVTLGVMGASARRAAEALGDALKDENEWVRRNAAEALGNIGFGAGKAVPALIAALEDKRPVSPWSLSKDGFRENVMMALLKIIPTEKRGDYPVFSVLTADPSEYVSRCARHMTAEKVELF